VPGAGDALTARVIEDIGFEAVYVTGAGIANTQLGVADLGLPTLTELVLQVQRIADAVALPLIVDADTGFGGPLNIVRTVRELERAGAQAIQLEDQASPKRCGHFDGKTVVPIEEMLLRLAAALDARRSQETLIVARTDARAIEGFAAAVARAQAYAQAGADVIFFEAPVSIEEFQQLPALVGAPMLANMVEGGKSPLLSADELESFGFIVVIFANTALRAAVKGMQEVLRGLRSEGTTRGFLDRLVPWDERQRLVHLDELQALERRYLRADPNTAKT
jgi:2-methylisocitrate lyase-like PEP mutase family enzyme